MSRWMLRVAPFALVLAAACSRAAPAPPDPFAPTHAAIGRGSIRARLAAHRDQQVQRLEAYASAGQFPHNYTTAPSLHTFRDDAGRLCAVANLLHQDGRDDLVDATAHDRNDLAIADVHDGPMLDWVLASGLTQEELVRIQLPALIIQRSRTTPPRQSPVPRPLEVSRKQPENAIPEAQMNAAVRAHITAVEADLWANAARSLDLAVDRYIARGDWDGRTSFEAVGAYWNTSIMALAAETFDVSAGKPQLAPRVASTE
jgi:hypothetical protein